MWPSLDSTQDANNLWVEIVVLKDFFLDTPVFPSPQKPTVDLLSTPILQYLCLALKAQDKKVIIVIVKLDYGKKGVKSHPTD